MALGISVASPSIIVCTASLLLLPPVRTRGFVSRDFRRMVRKSIGVLFVLQEADKRSSRSRNSNEVGLVDSKEQERISELRVAEKRVRLWQSELFNYLVAAVMSSFGITSMAVCYRFSWQIEGVENLLTEMFGTLALSFGAAVGMEFLARWTHKTLWHDSLWNLHESHHNPREGLFELNDVFFIINAVPAIALLSFGFFHKGLVPRLCFGAGLGLTMLGMAYIFVHDGLAHGRFPVGPVADVPCLKKVAAAHQFHHSKKFNGVPYGFFLGPKELEEVGGSEELEKEMDRRI